MGSQPRMQKDQLRYDRMVEAALRGVVRDALRQVQSAGLPGDHHFYLTFRTGVPGVEIPDYLRSQYPAEMTIVLQYQFYDLEVTAERFCVTLSFGGVHEQLVVPFIAVTTFADPSVNFALQFQPFGGEMPPAADDVEAEDEAPPSPDIDEAEAKPTGTVVALDAFRKK